MAAVGGGALLLVILVFALKVMIKRFFSKLMAAAAAGAIPVRVKTVPKRPDQPWNDEQAVNALRHSFEKEWSFQYVGDMALEPMDGVYCSMLVHPQGFAAVVYDHKQAGVWADLVLSHGERGGLTVSNAGTGGMLKSPPFSEKLYLPGAGAADLWTAFLDRAGAIPAERRRQLNRENIARYFEESYADEMDWRNAQGGPTLDEVREVARKTPDAEQTEENIQSTYEIQQAMAKANLMEGLQERIKAGMSPEEKMRFRVEDLVIVHDRLSDEDLVEYVSSSVEDEEFEVTALPDACRDLPPLQAFEKLQELLPELVRFERVATLDFPLPTHAYRPPNGRIPIELFPHKHRPADDDADDC